MTNLYCRSSNPVTLKRLVEASTGDIVGEATVSFDLYRVRARDAAMAVGTALSSATAAFTANDVGRKVIVSGAGADGADLWTTIAAVTTATQVTLGAAAATSISGAVLRNTIDQGASQSMPYKEGSRGDYVGYLNGEAPLEPGIEYRTVITAAMPLGTTQRFVRDQVAVYREV